jgi:uncharacterized membrane protein HdeD (DUF308 family)
MQAKALLLIGSAILILEGGFIVTMGFATDYMTLAYYGFTLLCAGIIGVNGVFLAKQKKAGYFFIIMGLAIWLPVVLTVMFIGDGNGDAGTAALCLGLPALMATVLWCAGGIKNIGDSPAKE